MFLTVSAATTTAGAANSGHWTAKLAFNNIGTTLPGTLVGFQLPPTLAAALYHICSYTNTDFASARGVHLVRLYTIGTLNLAATGNQFTHDAATFPVLRTQLGVASQPLTLIPLLYVTDATATTAPTFYLRTDAGGAGYTDQDGNSVVGTKLFTFPTATTTVNSCFIPMLEDGDSGVRDITSVDIETASAATATATLFGVEIISDVPSILKVLATLDDALHNGLGMMDLAPAVATSGTVTSYLCVMDLGVTSSSMNYNIVIQGVLNI